MTKDFGNLRIVEIELFNYCNRICDFCPNEFIDRKSKFIELPEGCFLNTLKELKDKDFSGYITFSRYNEPLYNIDVLKKRAKQVRKLLPEVTLIFNTNGDFLSKDKLEGLSVDEISIMDLARIIIKLVNSNSKVVFDELPENDPLRRKPDISKIKKSFDWEPLITLEDGLKLTADYFLK